jgi:putative sigma-54 modulation protein
VAIPIHVSGRRVLVDAEVGRRVEAKVAKLARVLPKIMEARVVLTRERYRHVAQITLHAKGATLHAEASAPDVHAAVDLVLENLDQQVRRRKERITARKPRAPRPGPKRARSGVATGDSVAEKGSALTVRRLAAKPMSVDEALVKLDVGRRSLLVFTNAATRVINVLRRRPDGSLELVEPVG